MKRLKHGDEIKTIEVLERIFKNNWEKNLIIIPEGRCLSYGDFFQEAFVYACVLREEFGIESNQIISLLLPNSVEVLIIYMAALIAEIQVAPIDHLIGERELLVLLGQIKPQYLITTKILPSDINVISLQDIKTKVGQFQNTASDISILKNIESSKPFLITFTSGSTGVPKGVIHSFDNLFKAAYAFGLPFNLTNEHRFYHNLPMSYMAGILNLFVMPLVWGCQIAIGKRFSVEHSLNFWETVQALKVNVFWFIPTVIALLLKMDRSLVPIRVPNALGFVGTAPLNAVQKDAFEKKYDIPLFESYGLSELLFIATNNPLSNTAGSVGKLLPGVESMCASDGELLVRVPWTFLGYWNLSYASYFEDGFYKTGDIATLRDDLLFITDRKKDLIIRGGINISPKAIENLLHELGILDEFVVIGMPDEILGEKITCFFVKRSILSGQEKKNIIEYVIKALGSSYRIDEFIHLESLPKNNNGKLDKIRIKNASV